MIDNDNKIKLKIINKVTETILKMMLLHIKQVIVHSYGT